MIIEQSIDRLIDDDRVLIDERVINGGRGVLLVGGGFSQPRWNGRWRENERGPREVTVQITHPDETSGPCLHCGRHVVTADVPQKEGNAVKVFDCDRFGNHAGYVVPRTVSTHAVHVGIARSFVHCFL